MYDAIIILGPTASGKTAISIELAKTLSTEIINADSMYIYKDMTIGTAKPTAAEMQGVKHHLIDIVTPNDRFSVSEYREKAKKCICELQSNNMLPIIVGGTGFYIDSLINTYSYALVDMDSDIRIKYEKLAREHGNEYIYNILKSFDIDSANKLHPNDVKRVIRAIEIYEMSGAKKSTTSRCNVVSSPILNNPLIIGLNFDRNLLYDKINRRVDIMLQNGLIDEVKSLINKGYSKDSQALKAIGYKEVISYLDGDISYDECIDKIKQHTRNYAKRQLTYFRRNTDIVWLDSYHNDAHTIVSKIMKLLNK